MKNVYILISLILHTGALVAAEGIFTQTLRGTVYDEASGYPLIGATVILKGSNPTIGTITDHDGRFALKDVAVGRQSIEVSYVGYLTRSIDNVLLNSAKETVVEVRLQESTQLVEEVVVRAAVDKKGALNEMAMVSSRTFSVEETERFAGSLGDPARMVANYAGVMTQNDSRNDIIIRGNSPIGVLWRMEGVEIANPNHFGALGTTGGPVSMINNNLLSNSDFLTGAFPAEYGNATAGAFDLNMRSGNNESYEYLGQIGFNGFEGGVEGPLFRRKKGVNPSFLVNYRYSTLDVANKLGMDFGTGAAIPEYDDLTFMVDVPGTQAGRFKLFGIYGNSHIKLGQEAADTTGNSYNPRGTATIFGSTLNVTGLTHSIFLTEKMQIRSTFSYQETGSEAIVDSMNFRLNEQKPIYRSGMDENKTSFSTRFQHKINARNKYSLGLIADFYAFDYLDSAYAKDFNRFITITNVDSTLSLFRAYAQWQHRINDAFTTYAGLHTQKASIHSEVAVEPRASLRWQFKPRHALNLGFGMHSQLQPKVVYYSQRFDSTDNNYYRTNEDVRFTRSMHYVLGYNFHMADDFRFRAETYYQHLYKVPVSKTDPKNSLLNAGDFFGIPNIDSLENTGTGTNYGLELTLEKFLSHNYYFLITASVFDSKYRDYNGNTHNTAFNGNHVLNVLGGYELAVGKNALLTFDVKTVWAGGRRYVPLNENDPWDEIKGEEIRDWNRAYEVSYSDYFRTDLRIGLKLNGKRATQEWALDLQNVSNHQNVFSSSYDPFEEEEYKTYQQGFMPMMLYRINF